MVTRERVLEVLNYDPQTSKFFWRVSRGKARVGERAGSSRPDGYRCIGIDGQLHLEHRLVWLMETGFWPKDQLDHADRNRSNNMFSNLREASNSENQQNRTRNKSNSSGYLGVRWHTISRKWQARINLNGKEVYLGLHDTPEQAADAYAAAKAKLHTFHPEVSV